MIQELVQLSERIRNNESDQNLVHDALCKERLDAYIFITPDGLFQEIIPAENKEAIVEDLVRTENKGRTSNILPRLLVDNEKYILGLPKGQRSEKCLKEFENKLQLYKNIPTINPVLNFYGKEKKRGLNAAQKAFELLLESKKLKTGTNFCFLIRSDIDNIIIVHNEKEIIDEIKRKYEEKEKKLKGEENNICSCCGSSEYRIKNIATHGIIDGILPRNPLGNYLISFEGEVFHSYGLDGNDNSMICTHCAKAYVEALNWLLKPYKWFQGEKQKKPRPLFKNRKDISNDTVVVFWLQNNLNVEDIAQLDEPDEEKIKMMMESVYSGNEKLTKNIDIDIFYSITLSGAAARIAVRDWIETSLENLRLNIVEWFQDIKIGEYRSDDGRVIDVYPPLWKIIRNSRKKRDVENPNAKDEQYGRIGTALWKCAVLGTAPPIWIIDATLNRIKSEQSQKAEQGTRTWWERVLPERISTLKLYMNRKTNTIGGKKFMSTLDETNKNIAYSCGRLFAIMESIQFYASGGNLNAGIRERFFSSASTTPSTAFGRLFKLSQKHLSKIMGEKPGLAINLDKQLQDVMCNIENSRFPLTFSLEDQASFAIGYYHQRQKDFETKSNNKEN